MLTLTNKTSKISFIGVNLGANNVSETAIAILDKDLNIITLNKVYTMQDIRYFFDNLPGKKECMVTISIPENEIMISSKWKYLSRTYHPVNLNSSIKNVDDWADRFSPRGSEYFTELQQNGLDIVRCDIDNLKKQLGLCYSFRDRTPVDCKTLQITLRSKLNIQNLPANMLPVSQLEAILCAYLSRQLIFGEENKDFSELYEYCDMKVYGI